VTSKTVEVSIIAVGSMCAIPVPFDPKEVFGNVRAPVFVSESTKAKARRR
jgi:hypothetical protein